MTGESRPGASGDPGAKPKALSLGTKLWLAIMAVLAVVVVFVVSQLTSSVRTQLTESKVIAGSMVARLFAASVAPAVDFADEDAVRGELAKLKTNPDVVYAAVWDNHRRLIAEVGTAPAFPVAPEDEAGVVRSADQIQIMRTLPGPDGKALGMARVDFSLTSENSRFLAARRRIAWLALAVGLTISLLVAGLTKLQVIAPLERLIRATRQIEEGQQARVPDRSGDELGQLGRAFNAMSAAIADREARLADVNRRIQQLLDNMREAILVFDRGGRLGKVHSEHARALFGADALTRSTIVDLLYPTGNNAERTVEAQAFAEWVSLVFDMPLGRWEELIGLAPESVVLAPGTSAECVLALEFIPIGGDDRLDRVMLLATDETEKEKLTRAVKEQEETHQRQMNAMRRLLAGGGQLLVSMLSRSRDRLQECSSLVAERPFGAVQIHRLFQHVHTIKGEARSFDLGPLEAAALAVEDLLALLRNRVRQSDSGAQLGDLERLASLIATTRTELERAGDLLVRASPVGSAILDQITVRRADLDRVVSLVGSGSGSLGQAVRCLAARPFGESLLYLTEAVPSWGARYGKRVVLEVEGRDVPIPVELASVLPAALTHLARNAVLHGIEAPEERRGKGKGESGLLVVSARRVSESSDAVEIVFHDDGKGLDREAITAQSLALGLSGPVEELVFASGLTTASRTDLAGFGVGLGAARDELRKIGYDLILAPSDVGVRARIAPRDWPTESSG